MVSPVTRRRAVNHLLSCGCSRVCACRVAGLSRTTSRYERKVRNPELVAKVVELAHKYPRFGFRRVHALLEGVNIKAVHRIWCEQGLRLKTRKRRRLRVSAMAAVALTGANQAWCLDFAHDRLENGRAVRILAVMDCFTRENLLLKAAPSYPAFAVQRELEWLFLVHGKPQTLISDNGPEFRALKLDIEQSYIQPGKPWQNGYIESFFGKLRDELLSCEVFTNGAELNARLDAFQEFYNHERPHLGLGGLSPETFKGQITNMQNGGKT